MKTVSLKAAEVIGELIAKTLKELSDASVLNFSSGQLWNKNSDLWKLQRRTYYIGEIGSILFPPPIFFMTPS